MNFGKILALTAGLLIAFATLGLGQAAYAADTDTTAASSAKTSTKSSASRKAKKSVAQNGAAKPHAKATGLASKSKTVVHSTGRSTGRSNGAQSSSGPSTKSKLGTDFDFQGLAVGGKYNSADGILTTVEGDKSLDNLLTPRPNFKDRLAVAAESQ